MLIDGKKINQEIGEKLFLEIKKNNFSPKLGILCVGNDPASFSFINVKKKFGEKYGFKVNLLLLPQEVTIQEVKASLENLQKENDGVILQLPLPERFLDQTGEILGVIKKEKDVDNLAQGVFQAPIVLALKRVLHFVETNSSDTFNLKKLNYGIVGLGQVVGQPIKDFLENNSFNVEIIKKGEHHKLKTCDVVISGVGVPYLIKKDSLKLGSILIDYGCSFVDGQARGDFDPECFDLSSFFTPVPGCMGPLVVACLFENVLESYRNKI